MTFPQCSAYAPTIAVLCLLAAEVQAEPGRSGQPGLAFRQVESVVDGALADQSELPGSIITREDATRALQSTARAGWQVRDPEEILADLLPQRSFLVQQLRSRSGRELQDHLAAHPSEYDRLDRLSQLSDGRRIVQMLVRGPDGYKLLEYLSDTQGGQRTGDMLSRSPGGEDFNEPTGRIYTRDQLIERLKQHYVDEGGEVPAPAQR